MHGSCVDSFDGDAQEVAQMIINEGGVDGALATVRIGCVATPCIPHAMRSGGACHADVQIDQDSGSDSSDHEVEDEDEEEDEDEGVPALEHDGNEDGIEENGSDMSDGDAGSDVSEDRGAPPRTATGRLLDFSIDGVCGKGLQTLAKVRRRGCCNDRVSKLRLMPRNLHFLTMCMVAMCAGTHVFRRCRLRTPG